MPGRLKVQTWKWNPRLEAPAKYRRACRYEAFVPDKLSDLDLVFPADLSGLVSEAEAAIRGLNANAQPALAPLARLLLRTESIASSKIEGMQLGVRELARAEARVETGRPPGTTVAEILANIDAMELAIDDAVSASTFGVPEIRSIHERLMAPGPQHAIGGQIRKEQNWIGGNDHNPCGADFVPPPADYVDGLMADLCDQINDEILPPIVQAALVHAQFETIHPFHDGNGRTGRALIHVILRRRGVAPDYVPPISVVLANTRGRYIRGLTKFRGDDAAPWIEYFAGAAVQSARLAEAYLQDVRRLMSQWRRQLQASPDSPRSDAAAWTIIEELPRYPMITAAVAAAAVARSKPQVYQAIEQLEAAGVLIPQSSGKRNQIWEAAGLLDLLAEMEAGAGTIGEG